MSTIKNEDIQNGNQFIEFANKIGKEMSRETTNSC